MRFRWHDLACLVDSVKSGPFSVRSVEKQEKSRTFFVSQKGPTENARLSY